MCSVPRSTHVLSFGKHRGQTLDQVPAGYLLWLHESSDHLPAALDHAICIELRDYFSREAARLEHPTLPADTCPRCGTAGLVELDLETNTAVCSACASSWRAEG